MRIFLVAWLVCQIEAAGNSFAQEKAYNGQIYVEAASYPAYRRILRSSPTFPSYSRPLRSRVFRNVQHIASFSSDEPRLYRASGRFTKRAQAVPIHELAVQKPESVQIISYNYDEDKHHGNKLSEDNLTMTEANEYARSMERTTVAVKTEDIIIQKTTPMPIPTTASPAKNQPIVSSITEERHEFKQPPPAFVQPMLLSRAPSTTRTFAQTVIGQATNNQPVIPNRIIPNIGLSGMPPPLPPPQPSPLQQAGQLFLPVPQVPQPGATKDVQTAGPPPQLTGQLPQLTGIGNLSPPMLPPPANLPTALVPNNLANGLGTPITPPIAPPPPPPPPPQPENRFEVINGQAANSSLEQLGCSFDWLTNTCKDVFSLGWCGRCHDFGNIFLHDCKCIQPLVQIPPRQQPQSPRPALFWLFN